MARYHEKLDTRASHKGAHSSVTISGDVLEVTLDEAAIAAELAAAAGAVAIERGIRAIPAQNGRTPFRVTNKLANGIAVERGADGRSAAVVAPPDRLQRDPKLVEKLAEFVAALDDPANTPELDKAIEKAADATVKVVRR